jgi:hypothetical protein
VLKFIVKYKPGRMAHLTLPLQVDILCTLSATSGGYKELGAIPPAFLVKLTVSIDKRYIGDIITIEKIDDFMEITVKNFVHHVLYNICDKTIT